MATVYRTEREQNLWKTKANRGRALPIASADGRHRHAIETEGKLINTLEKPRQTEAGYRLALADGRCRQAAEAKENIIETSGKHKQTEAGYRLAAANSRCRHTTNT